MIFSAKREFFNSSKKDEPTYRKVFPGPELELMYEYLNNAIPEPRADENLSIFIEPKVGNCYPDIVITYSNKNSFDGWNPERRNLNKDDLKIMHCLYLKGSLTEEEIGNIFPTRHRVESLYKLQLYGLVRKVGVNWKICNLRSNYAIRQLVAVEAKMSLSERVVKQSTQNTWFAPESYILVPKFSENKFHAKASEQYQLKVVTPFDKLIRSPRRAQKPVSYASWLFNEWAWRSTLK